MALPTTILFDLLGLSLVVTVSRIKFRWLRYLIIPIIILIHILMLDFSYALMTKPIIETFIASIITGFPTYIYAPLSIILIVAVDGFEFLTSDTEDI